MPGSVPADAALALKAKHARQAAQRLRAGQLWKDSNLVFCTRTGMPLAAGNIRREFRNIAKSAGMGEDWVPRETRHTFVSIMSDNDVPIELIADLVGHNGPQTTSKVYRHQLKPVISKGTTVMNTIVNQAQSADQTATTTRAKSA